MDMERWLRSKIARSPNPINQGILQLLLDEYRAEHPTQEGAREPDGWTCVDGPPCCWSKDGKSDEALLHAPTVPVYLSSPPRAEPAEPWPGEAGAQESRRKLWVACRDAGTAMDGKWLSEAATETITRLRTTGPAGASERQEEREAMQADLRTTLMERDNLQRLYEVAQAERNALAERIRRGDFGREAKRGE